MHGERSKRGSSIDPARSSHGSLELTYGIESISGMCDSDAPTEMEVSMMGRDERLE
jgi:hypothetical protein